MLGIIIGIASIITIVATIKGTNEQIKENLIGSGNNVVTVRLTHGGGGNYEFDWEGNPAGVPVISDETKSELEQLDGVSAVSLFRYRSYAQNLRFGNSTYNGPIYGVDADYFAVNDYRVSAGRGFIESDFANYRKKAVVDARTATSLFAGKDPVGATIEINGEPFVVVGIVEKRVGSSPEINSISDYLTYADKSSGVVFIPDVSWQVIYNYDEPQSVSVRASSTDTMTAAGKNAADALNAGVTNSQVKYEAEDLLEQASHMQELATSTNRQLIWIAGISLLVGGIGVMNIMMVSVTERTKEIGLKKAIGARRRRILTQFLTEAAVLCAIGGLLGVGFGIGFAKMLSAVIETPTAISVPACIIAVAFSTLIGIVFGLAPAVKASKLNPIEALNRE